MDNQTQTVGCIVWRVAGMLFVTSAWLLTACMQTPTPTIPPTKQNLLPTVEITTPTNTPTLQPPPTLQTDPRVAELQDKLALVLIDQECVLPCSLYYKNIQTDGSPLTVGELIETLGPPQRVRAYTCCAEDVYFYAHLFYIQDGITVRAKRRLNDNLTDMTPDMTVSSIRLWKSRTLEGIASEFDEETGVGAGTIVLEAQEWKGFGKVR